MIIPFFIPHSGCPHQCVFCNQKHITGQSRPSDIASMPQKISAFLKTCDPAVPVQIAFYGGSFTALPMETQRAYLEAAQPFIQNGQVESIRLSTRPDCVSKDVLTLLKGYRVRTVELGAQSMDDDVLNRAGRGHTAADTIHAVKLLRGYGFIVGLQLMPGLPGDSSSRFLETIDKVLGLKPDFVRIYPVLVIKDTPLAALYKTGRYQPLTLENAVALCCAALEKCNGAGIDVIRIGLQPTEELERPGTILSGPYHPAFRQLVDSLIFLNKMRSALKNRSEETDIAVFQVNPKDLSAAIGQRRSNADILKKEFRLREIHILEGNTILGRSEPILLSAF